MWRSNRILGICIVCALLACVADAEEIVQPSEAYLQFGGGQDVKSTNVGMTIPWPAGWLVGHSNWEGSWDLTIGRWRSITSEKPSIRFSDQVGLNPTVRYYFSGTRRFYLEGSVGANFIGPKFERGRTQESTTFNFGDAFGLGYRFGAHGEHDFSVRATHFSNACIKEPNPGQNFLQMRYAHAF